ncbi:MAG: hypothetical protein C4K49_02835 [Candidatus Thorarchaeota archaeon]|nr:MAG: hypothetical protein C4K49_02835 [Candidatus Thorarchaeota archaeon]
MDSLRHNGIYVLRPPDPHNLTIHVRGKDMILDGLQEEMAVAWVKKIGTPYVDDPVFKSNFSRDFSKQLGINPPLRLDDVGEIDLAEVTAFVEVQRKRKEIMTREEKKADLERRKAEREQLKEHYGYATVDSQKMELANYQTEPSGIFMGRGQHPLRGRWKQGASERDVTLNLDPSAVHPDGNWRKIMWVPDSMWIAKWIDRLTRKEKYIWLHDSTPIKQEREEAKFDKALRMEEKTDQISSYIMEGLHSLEAKRREIAAACYLIDRLSLRVGDEKDPDEADTVGATTLRVEHLTFKKESVVFDFLGKDSVPWHRELDLPPDIFEVFKELYERASEKVESFKARASTKTSADPKKIALIFPDVRSTHVNKFLSEVDSDLTAKVFRTLHATVKIRDELDQSKVRRTDQEFAKRAAFKSANLEVARVMNHTKQAPKGWASTAQRYESRIRAAEQKLAMTRKRLTSMRARLREVKKKEEAGRAKFEESVQRQKQIVDKNWQSVIAWRARRDKANLTWDNARDRRRRTRTSRRKGLTTKKERLDKAKVRIDNTRGRLDKIEASLVNARARYEKSRDALDKRVAAFAALKGTSAERIDRVQEAVRAQNDRVKKAEATKQRLETDYELANASRTWNLGTSLKSYVHPRVVHKWCQRVDLDWRSLYSKTLQRKFAWVEMSSLSGQK